MLHSVLNNMLHNMLHNISCMHFFWACRCLQTLADPCVLHVPSFKT